LGDKINIDKILLKWYYFVIHEGGNMANNTIIGEKNDSFLYF